MSVQVTCHYVKFGEMEPAWIRELSFPLRMRGYFSITAYLRAVEQEFSGSRRLCIEEHDTDGDVTRFNISVHTSIGDIPQNIIDAIIYDSDHGRWIHPSARVGSYDGLYLEDQTMLSDDERWIHPSARVGPYHGLHLEDQPMLSDDE